MTPEIRKMIDKFVKENSVQADRELSKDDLANVAGGVPEVFYYDGASVTRDQIYDNAKMLSDTMGLDYGVSFMRNFLDELGYPYADKAAEYFRLYGPDMWKYLEIYERSK